MITNKLSRVKASLLGLMLLSSTAQAQLKVSSTGNAYYYQNKVFSTSPPPQPPNSVMLPGSPTYHHAPTRPKGFSDRWVPVMKDEKVIVYIDNKTVEREVTQQFFAGSVPIVYRFWVRHPLDFDNQSPVKASADCGNRTLSLDGSPSTLVAPDTPQERIYGFFCASPNAQSVLNTLNQQKNNEILAQRKQENELNQMALRSQSQYKLGQTAGLFSGLMSLPALYGR